MTLVDRLFFCEFHMLGWVGVFYAGVLMVLGSCLEAGMGGLCIASGLLNWW